ncbi:ABC transporter, substrate-binding protein, aliphatic sulfonates family (plasmid) [Variovorax sp. SRS16]|uniref:ABC transporter substrate-binding protein n=1 Tax=Variovorax sp. SRS16 TaxID=282217 RepID=UPI001318EDB1|nr:ABC transporter substrate-binding protein [Variovorax sp. SRS16]VTU45935.1 ABC transporter, substrate-binding protein, aliphatic sulfonates family [Variovorax sp. SRS16]
MRYDIQRAAMGWARSVSLAIFALCSLGATHAQQAPLKIMVNDVEKQIYLPATIAKRLGFFEEQGLQVELLSDASGRQDGTDALFSGTVNAVVGFYDHTIDLQARGKFVQSVVQFSRVPGEAVLVASEQAASIGSPADFAGHRLGVTGLGSSTQVLIRYLALKHGVRLSDFVITPVGSGAGFVTAMKSGYIDAGMATEPTITQLLRTGSADLLVDLRTPQGSVQVFDGLYPGACLYMETAWIDTHRLQVQKLVNAFVKALRYIDAHSALEIAALLPPDYFVGDRAQYVDALAFGKSMFIADGRMPESGPPTVLRVLKTVQHALKSKAIDLSKTYTTDFVDAAP